MQYGDLDGKMARHGHATWGLDSVHVVREDGVDVVRTNEDPNVQLGSGYDGRVFKNCATRPTAGFGT